MSSGDDVTVVWVAPPIGAAGASGVSAQPGPGARDGREDAERALEQWDREHGLKPTRRPSDLAGADRERREELERTRHEACLLYTSDAADE